MFCTKFNFSCYSVSEPADDMHKCMNYLPWFPSLSLCVRCAMSKYMVVAKQRMCEKYIVPRSSSTTSSCRRLHTP